MKRARKRIAFLVCGVLMVIGVSCALWRPSGIVTREGGDETVVVLHGLNRTSRAMGKLAEALAEEGYTVLNCNYPSTSAGIHELSEGVFAEIAPRIANASRVHFVTHSMGGIVLRAMLQDHPLRNMGRAVMLAPPNQGSEITDALGVWWMYDWVNGPAGKELGTSTNSILAGLNPPAYPVGVIAGDRTVNPLFSWMMIPGADDGKVAVERTRMEGMADFVCLHVTHTWMMRNPEVITQVKRFLKTGQFD